MHHDDAIFLLGAVWVGDEARLLGDGHWWSPSANNFLLIIVIFVNWPVVLFIDRGLMHQLEEVCVSVLADALPFWIIRWQVDATEFRVYEVLHFDS